MDIIQILMKVEQAIIRVAVDAVPLLIAYLGREKLREIFPNSDYIVNMALIGFSVYDYFNTKLDFCKVFYLF